MKRGTTPTKKIQIEIDRSLIDRIIFTVKSGNALTTKRFPDDVTYEDGYYLLHFTQEDTEQLHGYCYMEAQINLIGGAVAKTHIQKFYAESTLRTEIIGNHAGGADEADIQMQVSDDIITVPVKGESDHNELINRDMADQHPITAITGLQEKLNTIPEAISDLELRRIIGNF